MGSFLLRRLVALVGVLLASTIVVFLVLALVPGDPAVLILGQDATPERVSALRAELGLDRPLWEQYLRFAGGLLQGDLGRSYQQNRPVTGELMRAFPVTLVLSTMALTLATVIGTSLGVLSAVRSNTWVDGVLRVVLLSFGSLPVFVLGLFLIYAFAVNWPLLPAFGWGTPAHTVLPALTLATFPLATIGRLTRAAMLDVLGQEYLTTARAKGLREWVVLVRHALRNALVPIVTVVALQFGVLLAGAVLTESIFSVPGMGQLLLNAVFARDYALIRGTVLLAAFVVASLSLVVDVLYVALDPRIRRA